MIKAEYSRNPNVKFNEHSNWFISVYPIGSPKVNASVYFDDKAYGALDYSKPEIWAEIRKEYL